MPIPVVIYEQAAAYRRGLAPALAAEGLEITGAHEPEERHLVLVPLRMPADCETVDRLIANPHSVVVALVPSDDPAAIAHALSHHVDGVAEWDAEPEWIAAVSAAAQRGSVLLNREAAIGLTARIPDPHRDRPLLDATEIAWVVDLARGSTVTQLADRYGYSERAMFRRLGELYGRLGAANRAEALVAAERFGLLGDPKQS